MRRATDVNTGIRFPAADQFAIVTGGSDRITVTNSEITIGPILTCNEDVYANATLFFSDGGSLTGNAAGSSLYGGTLAFATGLGASGASINVPRIHPNGDLDTGLYFPSANTVAVRVGGLDAVTINASYPTIDCAYLFNFVGTSAADQENEISTAPGDGSIIGPRSSVSADGWAFYGMARAILNSGVGVWVALYTAVAAPEE